MNTLLPTTAPSRRNAAEHLRLRHLRLLELIHEGGSLSFAARTLHLSQPAVTKMLHELEHAFAAPLVARGARGGRLTAPGEAALVRLRLAMAHVDAALAGVEADVPTLRLGLLPLVAVSLLPRALQRLHEDGRALRLQLRESTVAGLLEGLARGELDAVVGRLEPEALAGIQGLPVSARMLGPERLAMAAAPGHPLVRSRRVGLDRLAGCRWVLPHRGSNTRQVFDALFTEAGRTPPRPEVESQSLHTNLHLVAATDALTLAPASAVQVHERLGLVRRVRAAPALPAGMVSFITLAANEALPALVAFRDALEVEAAG